MSSKRTLLLHEEAREEAPRRAADVLQEHSYVIFASVLYLIISSILPVYQKIAYHEGYPYPLTLTWIDLAIVTVSLAAYSWVRHWRRGRGDARPWVFGEGFATKLRFLWMPGMFFAVFISMNNYGLYKVPVELNVLLHASVIVWVVLMAWGWSVWARRHGAAPEGMARERPGLVVLLCCAGVALGVALYLWRGMHEWSFKGGRGPALLVNLLSPVFSAAQVVTLRWGCLQLAKTPYKSISVPEITCFKMGVATLLIFLPSLLMENPYRDHFLNDVHDGSWYAIVHASGKVSGLVLGSALLTCIFQGCVVAMTAHSEATSVAVVENFKRIPQTLVAVIVTRSAWIRSIGVHEFKTTPWHIAGIVVIITSVCVFSTHKFLHHRKPTPRHDGRDGIEITEAPLIL